MPLPQSKNKVGLGKALLNRRAKDAQQRATSEFHTTDLSNYGSVSNLRSVTHEGDLEEFLNTAQLADADFTAERRNVTVISAQPHSGSGSGSGRDRDRRRHNPYLLSGEEHAEVLRKHSQNKHRLRVPRRPAWTSHTTHAQLERAEKDAFLEWRRGLAQLQDGIGLVLTPFERNIQVWRQLWRVIERSQLVVQIVDARNPLRFRCEDLEHYVASLGLADAHGQAYVQQGSGKRRCLLLINKADLLDQQQRTHWAHYFDKQNIQYAFFSAANAAAIQAERAEREAQAQAQAQQSDSASDSASDNEDEDEDEDEGEGEPASQDQQQSGQGRGAGAGAEQELAAATETLKLDPTADPTRVLNVLELEALFAAVAPPLEDFATDHAAPPTKLTVGLVGYPNVGKSSTINALLGEKKVSVSATPGKTKHFQTIHLSATTLLCDCPGLVFPQFAATSAELVTDGVLPIDQMREYTAPAELVTQRIPRDIIEATYGIRIPTLSEEEGGTGTPTGLELLTAYAVARGYTRQGQGNPDESRAVRYILKDYVNARLLYCHPPPGLDPDAYNAAQRHVTRQMLAQRRPDAVTAGGDSDAPLTLAPRPEFHQQSTRSRALDSAFFDSIQSARPSVQGRKGMAGMDAIRGRVANDGTLLSASASTSGSGSTAGGAGHKKHNKGNKRRKQRSGAGLE